jgi:hypothetical protein
MFKQRRRWQIGLAVGGLVIASIAGCASPPGLTVRNTPTVRAPLPTFTPRANTVRAGNASAPRPSETTWPTPGLVMLMGRTLEAASLYAGPGLAYAVVGSLNSHAVVWVNGRSTDGKWLKLASPLDGWVSVTVVELDPLPLLAIATPLAAPLPTRSGTVTVVSTTSSTRTASTATPSLSPTKNK